MNVLTWNTGGFTPGLNASATRAEAWARLAAVDPKPDFALLQESSAPPTGFPGLASGPSVGTDARIWARHGDLSQPSTLEGVSEHGWVATAQTTTAIGPVALVSLHAKTQGSAVAHVRALLDRLSLAGPFILAGDLNSCRLAEDIWPNYHHLEFFENAASRYGMVECFWNEHGREERTYWKNCKDEGQPFQDDHIFVSGDLVERVRSCRVLDYEAFRGVSDHTPIVLEIDL